MAGTDADHAWQYDIFISYARSDEDHFTFMQTFADNLRRIFHELTGREPRIFLDRTEIAGAELWQSKIESALRYSAIFLAIQTPSYFTSEWCARELDDFLVQEAQRRSEYKLLPHESLIFPIIRATSNSALAATVPQQQRHAALSSRQSVDLENLTPEDSLFQSRFNRLTRDIISILAKLTQFTDFDKPISRQLLGSRLHATTPLVTTYSSPDTSKLIQMLSEAHAVTIVGIANEEIADVLEPAIVAKRKITGNFAAFWDQLHIVFIAEELLPYIDDALSMEFNQRTMATQERIRRAALSRRRLMSLLLRYGTADRWSLFSYPFALPFTGILFAMPDGKRVVQLRMMRPARLETEYLKIEFIDRVDQFFESAFGEIVRASTEEHELIVVGVPDQSQQAFISTGSRFRRSVLIDGRNSSDWIAAVIAVMWRPGKSGPEPLLQIRTPRNSTREMGKASHLAGYVNDVDNDPSNFSALAQPTTDVLLPIATAENAVRRELLQHLGIRETKFPPVHIGNSAFYYPDKENLYFYIFSQEIDSSYRYSSDAQMFAWTTKEILNVRRRHVLSNVKELLAVKMTQRQRLNALELVVANLEAAGDASLATDVRRAILTEDVPGDLQLALDAAILETSIYKYVAGRELLADGLAGLQYRMFYSKLLPTYARLGDKVAEEHLNEIANDSARSSAVAALDELYHDEAFIASIPIEV